MRGGENRGRQPTNGKEDCYRRQWTLRETFCTIRHGQQMVLGKVTGSVERSGAAETHDPTGHISNTLWIEDKTNH
jgi:hypothetical protein